MEETQPIADTIRVLKVLDTKKKDNKITSFVIQVGSGKRKMVF